MLAAEDIAVVLSISKGLSVRYDVGRDASAGEVLRKNGSGGVGMTVGRTSAVVGICREELN